MPALELAQQLKCRFDGLISEPIVFRDEVSLNVNDSQRIAEVCSEAKKVLGFDFLIDISSLDHYGDVPRFTVVYELYGHGHHCHLRLRTDVGEEKGELPTVSHIWRGAEWHEREVFDMMGIRFGGHPDLRRLLMWDGYPYFPLLKDFPLGGKESVEPERAFSAVAPLEGGPFISTPGAGDSQAREPRAKS